MAEEKKSAEELAQQAKEQAAQQAADAQNALPGGEKPPVEKPGEEKPDLSKVVPDGILTMDLDELGEMDEHLAEHPEKLEVEEEREEVKPPGSEQKPEKKPEEEEEKPPVEDPKDKIIADQRSELTKLQQDRAHKEQETESAEWKGYKKPTDEDLDVLYDEDREAYDIAKDKHERYEQYQEEKAHTDLEGAYAENIDAVLGFLADHKKIELTDATRPELIKSLKDEKSEDTKLIMELDNYLQTNIIPVKRLSVGKNEKGIEEFLPVYSKEQIKAANNLLHMDDIIKSREDTIRADAAKQLEDAAKGGSAFDRMPPAVAGELSGKKPDEFTQDELLHMDEDQLSHVDKMYNPEG